MNAYRDPVAAMSDGTTIEGMPVFPYREPGGSEDRCPVCGAVSAVRLVELRTCPMRAVLSCDRPFCGGCGFRWNMLLNGIEYSP